MQLGKVIGGGLPVGAYGGRKDIMQMVAPAGKIQVPSASPFCNSVLCCVNGVNETTQRKHFSQMHIVLKVHSMGSGFHVADPQTDQLLESSVQRLCSMLGWAPCMALARETEGRG